jgi:hypothetical protein
MGRTSAIVVALVALCFAGVAGAHGDHHNAKGAKVYRAALANGKAHLVDGKKHNTLTIHLHGLTPGQAYTWQLHKAEGTGDPCAPTTPVVVVPAYGDWVYGALNVNAAGNASAKATSATFDSRADAGPFYVDVSKADGTVVACGVLKAKSSHAYKHLQPRRAKEGKGHGHGAEDGQDD